MTFTKNQSGDRFHASESHDGAVTFGIITVQPAERFAELKDAENLLALFMNGLQQKFKITYNTGIERECSTETTRSVLVDYWQDATQTDWKVKGCTNGNTFAVLYIKNISAVDVATETQFLDGHLLAQA